MNELLIFSGGVIIGALGVLVGATLFLTIPFLQLVSPGISYAQIISNGKVGSFFRGIASSLSTFKQIDLKTVLASIIPFMVGTAIGSFLTTKIDQNLLLPIIIGAIIISELSPCIAHLINKKTRFIFSFIIGIYGGFIGAGISILIIALLRTSFPKDEHLVFVRIQSGVVELLGTSVIFMVNLFYGNILWPLVFYWSLGMFIGGYLGGVLLKKSVKISSKMQKIYVYIIYCVAVLPLIAKFFIV